MNEYVESLHHNLKINWSKTEQMVEAMNADIDHQSVDAGSTFEEIDAIGIDEFLANEDCYIHNSNDNGGEDDDSIHEDKY
jgi:hypothetical protein